MKRAPLLWVLASLAFVPVAAPSTGCDGSADDQLLLGTTTSVQDSGLLDELVKAFEATHPYAVKPVVGGSGQVLEMAQRGELDVVLTHSPQDEARFVAGGDGIEPAVVMLNYFQLVGPPDDPAHASGAPSLGP